MIDGFAFIWAWNWHKNHEFENFGIDLQACPINQVCQLNVSDKEQDLKWFIGSN